MSKIINLTPHTINVVGKADFAPSGTVARVATTSTKSFDINGIPVNTTIFGDVVDLPQPSDDTFFIVSRLVKNAIPSRNDVVCPGLLIRDDKGQPIGCDGLTL